MGGGRVFEFRREPFRYGVISVAALNFRKTTRYVNEELQCESKHCKGGLNLEGHIVISNKMRTIFCIALANGHDSLVLGAFRL